MKAAYSSSGTSLYCSVSAISVLLCFLIGGEIDGVGWVDLNDVHASIRHVSYALEEVAHYVPVAHISMDAFDRGARCLRCEALCDLLSHDIFLHALEHLLCIMLILRLLQDGEQLEGLCQIDVLLHICMTFL